MEITDDQLRELLKRKFGPIVSAFQSFDKNKDGVVNKTEFVNGLRHAGVDLPKVLLDRIWTMADEDGSGSIHYQEFARKFCTFKASHSLHRHASLKTGEEQ